MAKRDREILVQAWFDPEVDEDKAALEVLKHFEQRKKMRRKDILSWALRVLEQAEWRDALLHPANRQEQILADIQMRLDELTRVILSGDFQNEDHQREVYAEYERARDELNGIESSLSTRYQALSFEDEEEG